MYLTKNHKLFFLILKGILLHFFPFELFPYIYLAKTCSVQDLCAPYSRSSETWPLDSQECLQNPKCFDIMLSHPTLSCSPWHLTISLTPPQLLLHPPPCQRGKKRLPASSVPLIRCRQGWMFFAGLLSQKLGQASFSLNEVGQERSAERGGCLVQSVGGS